MRAQIRRHPPSHALRNSYCSTFNDYEHVFVGDNLQRHSSAHIEQMCVKYAIALSAYPVQHANMSEKGFSVKMWFLLRFYAV